MPQIEGFDHRQGRHSGSGALRNLAEYYEWDFDEATCFGLGTGLGFLTFDRPGHEWSGMLGRTAWLEQAFLNIIDVSHHFSEGADWETAWDNLTTHIDMSEPVLLFLDPAELSHHAPRQGTRPLWQTVVAVGYDSDSVLISDSDREELERVPKSTLRTAWDVDRAHAQQYRHAVVTDQGSDVDTANAANRALREVTEYMLEPLTHNRTTGAFGTEHGVPAIRSFANEMPAWTEHSDAEQAARSTVRSIRQPSDGSAYRRLYADALEGLAPHTAIGAGQADRMRAIADEWDTVAETLSGGQAKGLRSRFEEAASVLEDVAEREQAFFEDIQDEIQIQ